MSAETCRWVQEDDHCGTWWSECSHGFTFNDGGPKENDFKFCCYCGKSLEEVPYVWPEDEGDDDLPAPTDTGEQR